jgi:hypothetical protein
LRRMARNGKGFTTSRSLRARRLTGQHHSMS